MDACAGGGKDSTYYRPAHTGACPTRCGEGTFLKIRRGRTECWIRRESLKAWIAARDAELALYMPRPEAKGALGLTNSTILKVAAAGIIRKVEGPTQKLTKRCFYFLREDVLRVKLAFEDHAVPVKEYSKPGELIALRHAMKSYLGRGSGLAAVLGAVVQGILAPVGYTSRFPGITGYLFRSEDVRKYRPVGDGAVALGVSSITGRQPRCWASKRLWFAAWSRKES